MKKNNIIYKEDHDELFPQYREHLDKFISQYPVDPSSLDKSLVNFSGNLDIPRHSWLPYKEGFSKGLLDNFFNVSGIKKGGMVLDPFCGVGTTLLESGIRGVSSVGFDVNPIAILAAKVKTENYSSRDFELIKKYLSKIKKFKKITEKVPKYKALTELYAEGQLDEVLVLKRLYEDIEETKISNFFKLAYLNIVYSCSNRIKDGNGIKIRKNYKPVPSIKDAYKDLCEKMISELVFHKIKKPKIFNDSSNNMFDHIDSKKINFDGCIFSPPYPNCFDYFEVYKIEMWLGDFVQEYEDFEKFRSLATRSSVNYKLSSTLVSQNGIVDIIAKLIGCYDIWNKNLPHMIRSYFDDMTVLIENLSKVLKSGSLCQIIVANSIYKGIIVPTDLLLAEISKGYDFKVLSIENVRNIRASSQQMKETEHYREVMRESIITLQRL